MHLPGDMLRTLRMRGSSRLGMRVIGRSVILAGTRGSLAFRRLFGKCSKRGFASRLRGLSPIKGRG